MRLAKEYIMIWMIFKVVYSTSYDDCMAAYQSQSESNMDVEKNCAYYKTIDDKYMNDITEWNEYTSESIGGLKDLDEVDHVFGIDSLSDDSEEEEIESAIAVVIIVVIVIVLVIKEWLKREYPICCSVMQACQAISQGQSVSIEYRGNYNYNRQTVYVEDNRFSRY